MMRCRLAERTLIGAFANLSALATELEEAPETELLCAGTRGEIAREDVLLAGAITQRITGKHRGHHTMNDQAAIAADAWAAMDLQASDSGQLASVLRETRGGRRLVEIGLERDIEIAARIDRVTVVPELDPQARRIRLRR
jgi:phosphosulfolactate phosphohydrolase-like enzyme